MPDEMTNRCNLMTYSMYQSWHTLSVPRATEAWNNKGMIGNFDYNTSNELEFCKVHVCRREAMLK